MQLYIQNCNADSQSQLKCRDNSRMAQLVLLIVPLGDNNAGKYS